MDMATDAGSDSRRRTRWGRLEEVGQVAFGVHLAHEHPLAVVGRQRARAAATVVLPTPPLPVTKTSLQVEEVRHRRAQPVRSACSRAVGPAGRRGRRQGAPKPTRRSVARRADLDVGDLATGTPTRRPLRSVSHRTPSPVRAPLDVGERPVAIGVLGQLDLDLLGRLDDPDAHVHLVWLLSDQTAAPTVRSSGAPSTHTGHREQTASRMRARPRSAEADHAGAARWAVRPWPACTGRRDDRPPMRHATARHRPPPRRESHSRRPRAGPRAVAALTGTARSGSRTAQLAPGATRAGGGRGPRPARGARPVADVLRA